MRTATPARAVVDAARRLSDIDACRALITGAIQQGAAQLDNLVSELAAGPIRHSALTRRVLAELSDGAHSVAEIAARKLYTSTQLPAMIFNADLVAADGSFIARPDGWIDSLALAWEIDSLRHHLSVRDHEATLRRRARMQNHGIVVVSHLPSQLRGEPATVRADLERAVALAASRPRPNVTVRAATRSSSSRPAA